MAKEEEMKNALDEEMNEAPSQEVEETPTSARETFMSNLRKKYPDINPDDEEGLYGAAMSGYDKEHDYAKTMRDQSARLGEAMQASPEVSSFMAEVYERGAEGHPELAFLNFGDLLKSYLNGDIDEGEYVAAKEKASKEEADKAAKIEEQNEVYKQWCEEKGYDPDEWMEQASEKIFNRMSSYELGKEQFDAFDKMMHYDEDVASAEESGRAAGRNEKIKAKYEKESNNDGLPRGSRGGNRAEDDMPNGNTRMSRILANRLSRK